MKLLLDHDVPHDLRDLLPDAHEAFTAQYQGWEDLADDDLLAAAEEEFDAFLTLDTNLFHQRNLDSFDIGVVVVNIHPILVEHLEEHLPKILRALSTGEAGSAVVVTETGVELGH